MDEGDINGLVFCNVSVMEVIMKAVLEYDLPEERHEFLIASRASGWAYTLLSVDDQLRRWLKYGNEFKSADEALEAVRELIRDELDERDLSLEWL